MFFLGNYLCSGMDINKNKIVFGELSKTLNIDFRNEQVSFLRNDLRFITLGDVK